MEEFDNNTKYLEEFIKKYENNNTKWQQIEYNEIKLGDIIIIHFIPFSQKYIYDLYPKFGKVVRIDDLINVDDIDPYTIENIYLQNSINNIYNASHDWCGYFGNTRSYTYDILKLVNK